MKFSQRWAFLCVALLLLSAIAAAAAEDAAQPTVDAKYSGISWGPLGRATLAELPEGTLLTAGGLKITRTDLTAEITKAPSEVRSQLNNYSFFMLEQMVTGKLLTIEAKAWAEKNKATPKPDELLGAYLDSAVQKVEASEEEIEKFRKDNEALLSALPLDEQKSEVKRFLDEQKRGEAVEKYVKSIGGRHKISISAEWTESEHKKWMKNPVEQARKSGKPSLLDFGAEWCMPCKQMAPIISALKDEYKDKVNIVYVNTDEEPILATHYGANTIPLLVFYDKDGKESFRHNGVMEKKEIEDKLKALGL